MSMTPGLVALALIGAGGAAKGEAPAIAYHVRFLEMDGLGWRESLYPRLSPVARRGTATVWTAAREVVPDLKSRALNVVPAPRVVAKSGAVAHLSVRKTRKVAADMTRHADGPFDHATRVAYTPEYEELREGFQATVTGRKLDQGVLARLVLEDSRVVAVHQVTLNEAIESTCPSAEACTASPRIDVPEVVKGAVEGEWLIPKDGVLVLSLGTFTTADGDGKAVVRERLAVLEAIPMVDPYPGRLRPDVDLDIASGRPPRPTTRVPDADGDAPPAGRSPRRRTPTGRRWHSRPCPKSRPSPRRCQGRPSPAPARRPAPGPRTDRATTRPRGRASPSRSAPSRPRSCTGPPGRPSSRSRSASRSSARP